MRREVEKLCAFVFCAHSQIATDTNTSITTIGVVFEDTPSGVRSGRAAGCKTIGLLTTHTREMMEECQPDFIVEDLSK